jgi:UrcA family protein
MSKNTAKNVNVARFVIAFGIATLTFGAASTHASDLIPSEAASQTVVGYTDLNLSKEADVRTLYTRLQRASERVCGDNYDLRDLRAKSYYDDCYAKALARAVSAVNHSGVTAMFAADSRIKVAGRVAKVSANT